MSARFSAMVIKSTTAHIFHVGDCRIYRVAGNALEQLTDDHRVVVSVATELSRSRAWGSIRKSKSTTRRSRSKPDDIFLLATDGVYEHRQCPLHRQRRSTTIPADLDGAAKIIVDKAFRHGSRDNLTIQIVRIDELPRRRGKRSVRTSRPSCRFLRCWKRGCCSTAIEIVREMHGSSRSHIYLAVDTDTERSRRPQDSIDRPARRSCLPEAVHDGRVGRPAHRQSARVEAPLAFPKTQLTSTS